MPMPVSETVDDGFVRFLSHLQFDSAARLGVLGRVRQQVGKHLSQPVEVTFDKQLLGARLHGPGCGLACRWLIDTLPR